MAVPTFVSAGAITTDLSGAASTQPSPPAHVADDILVAVCWNEAPAVPATASGGWSAFGTPTTGFGAWWARATGSGTAGPVITASGTDQFAIVYVIRGCITTGTPFEDLTELFENTTTPRTSQIDTLGADRLAICFAARAGGGAFSSGNPPSGWAAASNVSSASGTACTFNVITITQSAAGSVAQVNIGTLGGLEDVNSWTAGFIPPASAFNTQKRNQTIIQQAKKRASFY